jgi:hypothetical protein
MKIVTLLLSILIAPALASAAELNIFASEPLVVETPAGWVAAAEPAPGGASSVRTVRIVAPGERNAACMISIVTKNRSEFKDPKVLKALLREGSGAYLSSRAEADKIEVKELPIKGGLAFYANFTDPDLVGKPVKKGSYKTATPIFLSIGAGYLINVTIFCDDLKSRDYTEALEMVKSLQVAKPSA